MAPLFTAAWWKAAGIRAVRTAIVIAIPYVAASTAGPLPYYTIASAAGLGIVLSFLTSLAGLAELQSTKQNYFLALTTRVAKTVAQALVTAIGTSVFFTDVSWSAVGALALSAGLGSLLLGVLTTLPEADVPPATPATGTVSISNFTATPAEAPAADEVTPTGPKF